LQVLVLKFKLVAIQCFHCNYYTPYFEKNAFDGNLGGLGGAEDSFKLLDFTPS